MNLVLFFLIGAGINSLAFGLTCLLWEVMKNSLTQGVAVVMFIISVIVTIVISIYTNNIYGFLSSLCVLSGYVVSIMLLRLAATLADRAE